MKMKTLSVRIISALTALTLCSTVLFTGCGSKAADDAADTAADTAQSASDAAEATADPNVYINSDWTYGQVAIGGGGFVTGIISTSQQGLFYARTDVGGAYRWDNDKQTWVALNYDITVDDVGLLSIDGIAVDPENPAKVYLAAGCEYFSSGKTCILISEDYGEHFTQVDVSDLIRVHGNGMGRGNGERIAVDPTDSNIIYCGGRTGGIIKSTDGGKTWAALSSFPVTNTKNGNGVCSIAIDGASGKIYAGISERKIDNLLVSEDGGDSWKPVENAFTDYMPQRMKLDSQGRLYVTYANNEGPWNAMTGAIYRYDTAAGTADNVSLPIPNSTGDIVISPDDDNKLVAVTTQVWEQQPNGAFGDVFFVSTDGGASWTDLQDKITMSTNGMDWIANAAIHWCSSLAIDPTDENKILVNSGNGIFACDNIWADSPEFYFDAKGIEEVVPEDIVTLKDYPLITAIGDYDGFVHDDIYTSAKRHTEQIGSCTSISVAAQNKDVWIKVGGDDSEQKILYTENGGESWTYITNQPDPSKIMYKGKVAVTCDGNTFIWSPSNSNYSYYTTDRGKTWNQVDGLMGQGAYLMADPVNPDYVYANVNSVVYVSADGGKSFKRKYDTMSSFSRMCAVPDKEGAFYVPGGGLLYTEDHGETFTMVEGLKRCEAVGLGKPKNDGDPYVIYVWGIPKDQETIGIYMSEDNGKTWVRVNDDLHNFGGTGNGKFISGDMNVYGRCYMSTVGMGIAYCDKINK